MKPTKISQIDEADTKIENIKTNLWYELDSIEKSLKNYRNQLEKVIIYEENNK